MRNSFRCKGSVWMWGAFALAAAMLLACATTGSAAEYRDKGYLYLSPLPGAEYTPPQTRFVLVRFEQVSPGAVTNLSSFIEVSGAVSGAHPGVTRIASDQRTVLFETTAVFQPNEVVTVSLHPQLQVGKGGTVQPYEYQFAISGPMPGETTSGVAQRPDPATFLPQTNLLVTGSQPSPSLLGADGVARIMPNGVSVPSDFPQVTVITNRDPSDGYFFLNNPGLTGQPYVLILNNDGYPVWYQRGGASNFRVQDNGVITWGAGIAFDQNFNLIRGYSALNGYGANWHDFRLLADGTRLMIGDSIQTVDLTRFLPGASSHAEVWEQAIQEFTPEGDLIFQFRGWDHYDIRDTQIINPLGGSVGFPHMNAITADKDGHLLVSCRNLNEITKINRDTGEIIWRLGGAHSDFTFVNDPANGFSAQHDISALGDDQYMVFDNGTLANPMASRAVEYRLDLTNMTATLVWQFHESPDRYTDVMGNVQRLPDGHTLINFVQGRAPRIIEVDQDGTKQLEMDLSPPAQIYRVLKFPWSGVVSWPYLIAEAYPDNVTLLFNKFGDTNVAYYRIYGGTSSQPTNLLASTPATMKRFTNLENGQFYYFRVTAVNNQGSESSYSNQERVFVNLTCPGQNMILNGDFSQDTIFWTWKVEGTAAATWAVTNGASHVTIATPGTQLANVQLSQTALKLLQKREYVLEFDAWAALPRLIEVRLEQNQSPWTAYQVATCSLTPLRQHFIYSFVMQKSTDLNARLGFGMGASTAAVYLGQVSLTQIPQGDFDHDRRVGLEDLRILTSQWLQQGSTQTADLNGDGRVDFEDFGILGENWSASP